MKVLTALNADELVVGIPEPVLLLCLLGQLWGKPVDQVPHTRFSVELLHIPLAFTARVDANVERPKVNTKVHLQPVL